MIGLQAEFHIFLTSLTYPRVVVVARKLEWISSFGLLPPTLEITMTEYGCYGLNNRGMPTPRLASFSSSPSSLSQRPLRYSFSLKFYEIFSIKFLILYSVKKK